MLRNILKLLLICLFLMSGFSCNAQKNNLSEENEINKKIIIGIKYTMEQDYNKALDVLDEAIRKNPKNADCYLFKGNIFTRMNKYDKALENFKIYSIMRPDDYFGHASTASIYLLTKDFKNAIKENSKALEINNQCKIAYLSRGAAYSQIGEHCKSITDLNYAINLNHDRKKILDSVSCSALYYICNEFIRTEEYLNALLYLEPIPAKEYIKSPVICYQLGYCYMKLKKNKLAKQKFEEFLELAEKLDKFGSYRNKAKEYLEIIGGK